VFLLALKFDERGNDDEQTLSVVAITFSFVAISPFSFVVVVVVVVKSLLKERESST